MLASNSVSYGKATPYLPVIDLLKGYCGIDSRDDLRRRREKVVGKVLGLDEALRPTLPAILTLLEVPVDEPQWQALDPPNAGSALDALKRVLLHNQVQPLLLVFEDLHWIDTETQALLDSLVESLQQRTSCYWSTIVRYQHGWGNKTYYTQLRRSPAPGERAGVAPGATRRRRRSGAPYAAVDRPHRGQSFLSGRERAHAGGDGHPGRGTRGLSSGAAARYLAHAARQCRRYWQRIDRLPPEEKRLLQTAAVIGTEVPLPVLQAIAELPEAELHRGLAHLQAAEFLYETRLFPDQATPLSTPSRTRGWWFASGAATRAACSYRRGPRTPPPDRLAEQVEHLAHTRATHLRGSGTRPWYTSGRRGRKPWHGRLTARPWGTSSRRSVPSSICQRSATRTAGH